jgi:rhodanese-related sulfurtransferase/DNA-binding transcriptional ArsR family regulator
VSSESPKRALFSEFAAVAKGLANTNRLELLEFVAQGEIGVARLAQKTGMSIANTSQHLQHLRRAGLVSSRRVGKGVLYCLADDTVIRLLALLREVAERNVADVQRIVDRYFQQRDELEPVTRVDLIERLRANSVVLLDVRPEDEYAAGHLPRAVNIQLAELERKLRLLPRDQEVVAYCRGPYCVLSFEAIAILRRHGYNVRRFEDGFPEWKAAGMPIETGSPARN